MQNLYDTPGVHLHHRQTAVVHSEDLSCLAPRSRLRGLSFPVCLYHNCSRHIINSICQLTPRYYCQNSQVLKDNEAADHSKSNGLNGFSIFWGGLVRIDALTAKIWGCLMGIKRAWDGGFRDLLIRYDSYEVIDLLQNEIPDMHEEWQLMIGREKLRLF